MPKLVAGQYGRVKNHGLIHKGDARRSRPVKVVKALDGAVQLEDGRIRNLRHLSLFKACGIPEGRECEELDEANGYLWGDNSILQSDELRSGGVDESESRGKMCGVWIECRSTFNPPQRGMQGRRRFEGCRLGRRRPGGEVVDIGSCTERTFFLKDN
ncbi:hypothetical protein NDU88_004196 [Pleurodeles waltl]|uniref:Uncharacterized protein n=1 Tax=Pleurodeles waltl TaxID=8319 RepID=A0AAV7T7N9_PLEWA|nr:hypothetical protein NDU88_004196 [Pleurodeles waltl]